MEMDENNKTWDFDNWAERYDEEVHNDQEYYARYDEILDMVVKVANITSQKRILDIGTGTGNLARRFLACGATVVGLDRSEKMLAVARKKIVMTQEWSSIVFQMRFYISPTLIILLM